MRPVDPALADFARTTVSKVLGQRVGVGEVYALSTGGGATVLGLRLKDSDRLVLKVAHRGDGQRTDFERTAAVIALARGVGVPAPAALGADSSSADGPWHYLLLKHVDGVPWRQVRPHLNQDEALRAYRQIARAVLRMQSVSFASFGELDPHGEPAGQSLLAALQHRGELRIGDPRACDLFQRLLDRDAHWFQGPQGATLCHDDLHHDNLIFRVTRTGWELAAVLDWDKAWAGPAESDIARMAFWDDMTGPGFWDTYRAVVPADEGHQHRALVYQLLWCLEYDNASPRHATDTAALCTQLGL